MLYISVLIVLGFVGSALCQTMPTGCTYTKGMYECDYSTLNSNSKIPLDAAEFSSPVCQRLRLTNLPASLTSTTFQNSFYNLNTASFDTNWPMTIELKCTASSALTLGTAALTNLIHVKDFKIINCALTVEATAFSHLNAMDRLTIENGSIASIDATAFQGMAISKLDSPSPAFPITTGALIIKDSPVTGGTLPASLLSSQSKVVMMVLEGLGLTSLDASMFSNNTKVRFLSLGHNSFTELPSGLFDTITSLTELRLYATTLECTCDKLWFYGTAKTTRMKIYGDVLCSSPTDYVDKKAMVYYYANCVTVDDSCKELDMMGVCISFLELGLYILCILAFILAIVVLGLTIHTRRQLGGRTSSKRGGAKKKGPPRKGGAPKGTKKGWA